MTEKDYREYTRKQLVPVYDVGPQNVLKFGTVLRFVQETSEQHLTKLHASYEELKRQGLVFFIISTRMRINRMPEHNEMITISTHPRGRHGAQFYRDFKFYDENESLLIDVMQTTALIEASSRKVQRPQKLKDSGIYREEKVEPEERISKIILPEEMQPVGERRVVYSDLDANGHMNNTIYGDVIVDFLPRETQGKPIREMQITYMLETKLDDVLKIYLACQNGRILMRGDNSNGISFTASVKMDNA